MAEYPEHLQSSLCGRKHVCGLALAYSYYMRALLQRVSEASVHVDEGISGQIAAGLLVFLAVEQNDTTGQADYLLDKIVHLRIFPDGGGKMNLSLLEVEGELLVVSQFTLYGDCRRGRRPSFARAAPPGQAKLLYDYFVEKARARNLAVSTGVFQATMSVHLINDGPVTLICDSDRISLQG